MNNAHVKMSHFNRLYLLPDVQFYNYLQLASYNVYQVVQLYLSLLHRNQLCAQEHIQPS